jgi:nucleotide-binding universal stress UspA family protein
MTTTVRQILCASDLSPASEPAWLMARRLGGLFGAEVVLLHVVPPVPIPLKGYFPPQLYQELVTGARREAEASLAALVGGTSGAAPKVRTRVVEGSPAARIAEETADLVVVGTHGRTGLDRAVLGSVADRLVRTAKCPVRTVRTQPPGTTPATGLGRILSRRAGSGSGPGRAPRGRGRPGRGAPGRRRRRPTAGLTERVESGKETR